MKDLIYNLNLLRELTGGVSQSNSYKLLLSERANKLRIPALKDLKLNIRMVPCLCTPLVLSFLYRKKENYEKL